jgi:agmatine/peptidylarginine deiminase
LAIAICWCGVAGAETTAPRERLLPTRVLPTADELANPQLYHPRPPTSYAPPPYLPPPPPASIVRPGEFEQVDSTIVTVLNYGGDFMVMWREMIAALATAGHVWIITDFSTQDLIQAQLFAADVPADAYSYLNYPVNTIWIRDYGPEFVIEPDGTRHVIDGQYDPSRPLDDAIPVWVAASDWIASDGEPLELHGHEHQLYTGNIFTDGAGTCFFTYTIYGHEKPVGWTDEDVDQVMHDYFGCDQIIALNPICLDPIGQVNNFAKAVGPTSIALGEFPPDTHFDGTVYAYDEGYCGDTTPNDYQDMEDNLAIIESTTNIESEPWQVTRIPMLEPAESTYDMWIYRTYTNAELIDDVLVMPAYYEPHGDETAEYLLDMEAEAIAAFEDAAPGIEVHPVDADAVIELAGALHSIAHEIPAESGWEPPATYCGDDEIDGDEDCDGPWLGGATCESLGYDGGELACDEHCELDTSDCIGEADTDVDSDSDSDADTDIDADTDADGDSDADDGPPSSTDAPIETRCGCRAPGGAVSSPSLFATLSSSL